MTEPTKPQTQPVLNADLRERPADQHRSKPTTQAASKAFVIPNDLDALDPEIELLFGMSANCIEPHQPSFRVSISRDDPERFTKSIPKHSMIEIRSRLSMSLDKPGGIRAREKCFGFFPDGLSNRKAFE